MKKLMVNDRQYNVHSTEVICEAGKITVGGNYEIHIPEDTKVFLKAGAETVQIVFPA